MLRKMLFTFLIFSVISACKNGGSFEPDDFEDYKPQVEENLSFDDWTESTHSKNADPNFDKVFAQDEVMRVDITINSEDWAAMHAVLSANLGSSGGGNAGGGPGGGPGGRMFAAADPGDVDFSPIWVPCNLCVDSINWYKVGVRFKGNSSLRSAYQSGINKLSLKLDFDQFEDDYPELKNQRFYGFKQLNLNNNYNDHSFMREKMASDLFRQFGLAAAHTRFCAVYIDTGNGVSQYFGLYVLVEEVDDTVIETQFVDGSGNLYKPEENAASFANGSYNEQQFDLKTNEDAANYNDVKSLYDVLHSSVRTTDVESWKSELEGVFNVDVFLKWLAVTTTIQNWDTYGTMTHNFYLYNNPENNLLTWIPWDHNEAFQSGQGNRAALNPDDLVRVGSSWPLIAYIIAIDEYKAKYDNYLRQFTTEVFVPSEMQAIYEVYKTMLKDFAYAEVPNYSFLNNSSQFDMAVNTLINHAQSRFDYVDAYLR